MVCCKDCLRLEKYMSVYIYIQINQEPANQTQKLHFIPLLHVNIFLLLATDILSFFIFTNKAHIDLSPL